MCSVSRRMRIGHIASVRMCLIRWVISFHVCRQTMCRISKIARTFREAGKYAGNDQEPVNWGPPSLTFATGIAGCRMAESSFESQSDQRALLLHAVEPVGHAHNVTFGAEFRKAGIQLPLATESSRDVYLHGAAARRGFRRFSVGGVPDTSAIAFGNADKYFRESVYDAFLTDDWRIAPELTLNAGVRWEYGAPITELYGRLVNLDIAPGFTGVAPVVAGDPGGILTAQQYPTSLVHPDKQWIRAARWNRLASDCRHRRWWYARATESTTTLRCTRAIALQMAQQSPLSKSLSVQNSSADPLTLANGFNART